MELQYYCGILLLPFFVLKYINCSLPYGNKKTNSSRTFFYFAVVFGNLSRFSINECFWGNCSFSYGVLCSIYVAIYFSTQENNYKQKFIILDLLRIVCNFTEFYIFNYCLLFKQFTRGFLRKFNSKNTQNVGLSFSRNYILPVCICTS